MATCPECDAEIEVDEFDVDKGDQLSCPECGSNLEVIGLSPIELDIAPDDETTTTTTTRRGRRRCRRRRRRRRGRGRGRGGRGLWTNDRRRSARCATRSRRWARSSSPTAAASTAPISPASPAGRSATAPSPSPPTARAIRNAIASSPCRSPRDFGLRHEIIHTSELERPEYRANPANRCYYCKHELYTHLSRIAAERGAVVVDGNNADDRGDYRPGPPGGARVRRPQPARRSGSDARTKSASCRAAPGLPTWDEPASACLSSRIPYHTEVTDEKLRTIERAEQALRALGFRVFRVRHHDELARIEIARDEMPRALEPEIGRGDRPRAEGGRLPLRQPRSAGLPHRQPERRAVPAAGVSTDVDRRLAERAENVFSRAPRSCVPGARRSSFLALHLPYLPPSLEDLDSINFALGVRDFDVAHHQPHPPGLSGLSSCSRKALHAAVAVRGDGAGRCVSVVAGALGVLALAALFRRLERRATGRAGVAAACVAMTSPLYWFTAARPLSDMAGLAAALARPGADARAPAARARRARPASAPALATGVRSQVAWLTVPLLIVKATRCWGWLTA